MSQEKFSIWTMRHGSTDANIEKRRHNPNEPLNEKGKQEVREKLERLPEGITVVYSSSEPRAKDTAAIVAEHLHLPITYRDELKEINAGEALRSKPWKEIAEILGLEPKFDRQSQDYRPHGGESGKPGEDFDRRILGVLKEIRNQHPNEKVLLVTHGGVIRRMHKLFPDEEKPERGKPEATSIHEFDIGTLDIVLMELNPS